MPPVDPSNGCTSLSPLPGDVNAQSGRRWPRPRELRFCPILGIPSWLMPLCDRSGQRWQPLGSPSLFLSLFPLHLPSSLGVPGCFCHSWEPFSALLLVCPWTLASWLGTPSFLLFPFFSRLSLPLPPVGTLAWVAPRGSWPSY